MLYGRDAERAVLLRLLGGAREGASGAIVVRGEPGVGKSALLADTLGATGELRVLRATGIQSESELAFAALHQLLRGELFRIDRIPGRQADALAGALGLAPTAAADRFLVSIAVLSVLADAAEEQPIVCVVDDAQWLDQASADALCFAARRLHAEPIAMLFAARDGDTRPFAAEGIDELHLQGLGPGPATELLAHRTGAPLPPDVADRLVSLTGGNPLALLELSAAIGGDRFHGDELIALPERVEREFTARARSLPDATQVLVLLAAADDGADPGVFAAASGVLRVDPLDLAPAELAGLVRVTASGIEFRHPLVRSAIYHSAPFSARQAVHRALAAAVGAEYPDRRAWHRATATLGHDETVATEMEATAARARQRGGHVAAAVALERAAALTPLADDRARRLAAAARAAWLGGQPQRSLVLAGLAEETGTLEVALRVDLAHLRGTIELRCGNAADALMQLSAAVAQASPLGPRAALMIMGESVEAAMCSYDDQWIIAAAERFAAMDGAEADPETGTLVEHLIGKAHMLAGRGAEGTRRLENVIAEAMAEQDPLRLLHIGAAAVDIGDDTGARLLYGHAAAQARDSGAVSMMPHVLGFLARVELIAGRLPTAMGHATEGLRLADETRQESTACLHRAVLAAIAAYQGRDEDCRREAQAAMQYAAPRALRMHTVTAVEALAMLALQRNRPAEALSLFTSLGDHSPGQSRSLKALLRLPDFVDAAVRAGARAMADDAVAALQSWAHFTTPHLLALLARCRGLVSDGHEAEHHFATAFDLHALTDRRFELARSHLLLGEAMRRNRRRTEARPHLRAALEVFEQVGATPWADRAAAELRATGETTRRRDVSTFDQLTPQERQIIAQVGEGETNKQIAAGMFLSPRTVDYHLRNVFSKLQITSRTELMRLHLAGDEPLTPANR